MQGKVVRLHVSELAAGIAMTLFSSAIIVMMLVFPNETAEFRVFLLWGYVLIVGIVEIISWLLWRIEYNDEVFIYHNRFGYRTTVPYSSIKKVKLTEKAIHLYSNGRRYAISKNSKGENGFLEVLSNQLQDNVEITDRLMSV